MEDLPDVRESEPMAPKAPSVVMQSNSTRCKLPPMKLTGVEVVPDDVKGHGGWRL